MSQSQASIERARELGLPTSLKEVTRPTVLRLSAEERIVRDAILDMIDWKTWLLYERGDLWTEDRANADRLDFADAVIAKMRRADRPTHSETLQHLANLCERHKRLLLPKPTVFACADCEVEQNEKGNYAT